MKHQNGLTLIEMIIAVAVIGILAVVAVPAYQTHVASSEVNRCYNYLSTARLVADNLIQVASNDASGVTAVSLGNNGNDCDAGLVVTNNDAAGNITITGSVNARGQSQVDIILTRTGANGSWVCSSNASSATTTPDFEVIPEFCL